MAAIELYANNAATSLSGSITSGSLTLAVASAALFPPVPQFRVGVDSEYLLVTGVSGTIWGVQRGVEGSIAAAHASGATLTQVLTASGLMGVAGSVNLTGSWLTLPATGFLGRLYLPNDASYLYQEQATGWMPYGPLDALITPFPDLSAWTPVHFTAGSTSGQTAGVIRILAAKNAATEGCIIAMTAPATGYTLTAKIAPELAMVQYNMCGIGWRDSATDKQVVVNLTGATLGFDLNVSYAADSTHYFAGSYAGGLASAMTNLARPLWLRIQDDGSNRTASYSLNGYTFTQLVQQARTLYDGVTTMNPNQVIFTAASISSTNAAAASLLAWHVTHP